MLFRFNYRVWDTRDCIKGTMEKIISSFHAHQSSEQLDLAIVSQTAAEEEKSEENQASKVGEQYILGLGTRKL